MRSFKKDSVSIFLSNKFARELKPITGNTKYKMADEKKPKEQKKPDKKVEEKKTRRDPREELEEFIIRVYGYDMLGSKNIYTGLTRIKGISWTLANAICVSLNLDRNRKVSELSKEEIKKIEEFIDNLKVKDYQKNRRADEESGETSHMLGTDLDMRKDFDIRRMKKIRSYKGMRHSQGQPVRGQRTRSHFRKRGGAVGVQRGASKPAKKPKEK